MSQENITLYHQIIIDGLEDLINNVLQGTPNASMSEAKDTLLLFNPHFAADQMFIVMYPLIYDLVITKKKVEEAIKKFPSEEIS